MVQCSRLWGNEQQQFQCLAKTARRDWRRGKERKLQKAKIKIMNEMTFVHSIIEIHTSSPTNITRHPNPCTPNLPRSRRRPESLAIWGLHSDSSTLVIQRTTHQSVSPPVRRASISLYNSLAKPFFPLTRPREVFRLTKFKVKKIRIVQSANPASSAAEVRKLYCNHHPRKRSLINLLKMKPTRIHMR